MKRIFFAVAILLMPCMAVAGYESVTVSTAAVALGSSVPRYGGNRASCTMSLETAPIRVRYDGTAPTSAIGHIMTPGSTLKIQGDQIANFKAIRMSDTDATLRVSCNEIEVSDLSNIGTVRTPISYYATNVAAGATTVATAITMTRVSGLTSVSSGTSFVLTTGKKFKVTNITVGTRGHATPTIQSTIFSLMTKTSGLLSAVTASNITHAQIQSATAEVASAWDRVMFSIPDGYDFQGDGVAQFGLHAVATFTTNAPTWSVNIVGYEY